MTGFEYQVRIGQRMVRFELVGVMGQAANYIFLDSVPGYVYIVVGQNTGFEQYGN